MVVFYITYLKFVAIFISVDSPAHSSWRRLWRHSELPCWQKSWYQHHRL